MNNNCNFYRFFFFELNNKRFDGMYTLMPKIKKQVNRLTIY